MHNEVYQKIEGHTLTLQQLSDAFINIMPLEIKNKYSLNLIYIDALLLHFYNNDQDHQNRIQLFEKDANDNIKTSITINATDVDSKELPRLLCNISQEWNFRDTGLRYLINKINLTEPIVFS